MPAFKPPYPPQHGCRTARIACVAPSKSLASPATRRPAAPSRARGYGSFAPGNADGGLTTIEQKSLGTYQICFDIHRKEGPMGSSS